MPAMITPVGSWATPSSSPTQQINRTECCVLGTPTTPQPPYLTLSTSPVLTTGDTSSTTTTGLTGRILKGILITPIMNSVNWKCLVSHTFLVKNFQFYISTTLIFMLRLNRERERERERLQKR